MTGRPGRSGRKRTWRQQQRVAIAAAFGDVFPHAGDYALARLAGAILGPAITDVELVIIARALRSRRRTPWARNWRHGDGARAIVNGLGDAPAPLRRAVVALFDVRTSWAAEAALRNLGMTEVEISRLQILAGARPSDRGPFSYHIARTAILPFLSPLIRKVSTAGMYFKIQNSMSRTLDLCSAVARAMPDISRIPNPQPSPAMIEAMNRASAIMRAVPNLFAVARSENDENI